MGKYSIPPTKKQWFYIAAMFVGCSIGAKIIEMEACVHTINDPRTSYSRTVNKNQDNRENRSQKTFRGYDVIRYTGNDIRE